MIPAVASVQIIPRRKQPELGIPAHPRETKTNARINYRNQ